MKKTILIAGIFWLAASAVAAGQDRAAAAAEIRYAPRPASVEGVKALSIPLDGLWQFASKPGLWAKIRVPGDWTMQGFSVAPNTAAEYAKTFDIPGDWAGRRIKLRCDGVQSEARISVNGRPAGEHQGGFTAFELDITKFVRPGRPNAIRLAVQNESQADELASGTQYAAYQFGGITRKISLIALPDVNIASMNVETDLDPNYRHARLKVLVRVANESPGKKENIVVSFGLSDPGGNPMSLGTNSMTIPFLAAGESVAKTFETAVEAPKKWDPEHPNLYVLTADLKNGPRTLETAVQRIGFRKIEVAGNKVFVNGRPIKVRGVNRHETHPLLGRSLTPELWRRDAELFRDANINYIRTSHYPPAEEFLDACDELGLFVECEAPLVWIGHNANDKWKKEDPQAARLSAHIKRAVAETIEFNRNHPSIIIWSLANESAWGPNWAEAKRMADTLDPTRPKAFHDQAFGGYNNFGSSSLPIANYHYPSEQMVDDVLSYSRPVLFGEYCHLNCYNRQELAADPGVRDEYGLGFNRMWEKIYGAPACLGGAIWAGINDIFFLPSGKAVGYGEWGLIDGWRREKPEYWHVKKSYTPVKIHAEKVAAPAPGQPLQLPVTNRHDFTDLNELKIEWRIGQERGTASADLPPHQTGLLRIAAGTENIDGRKLRLDFTSPRGFLLDSYEIQIGEEKPSSPPFRIPAAGAISLRSDADSIVVKGEPFEWAFDKKSGTILRAIVGGVTVALGGPVLMLLPQATGPCVTDYSLDIKPLNDACGDWTAESVEAKEEPGAVAILVRGRYKEAEGQVRILIDGAGEASFEYAFKSTARINPRQSGLVFYLPRACDTLTWKRKGLWSVYPPDHIGRLEGTARAVVPGAEFKYGLEPKNLWKDDMNELGSADFRSTKSDLFWSALTAANGAGLALVSDGRHASRAFLDKDRVGYLVADFNTGGGDLFYAGHHKVFDRPLEKGEEFKGAFKVRLVEPRQGSARDPESNRRGDQNFSVIR